MFVPCMVSKARIYLAMGAWSGFVIGGHLKIIVNWGFSVTLSASSSAMLLEARVLQQKTEIVSLTTFVVENPTSHYVEASYQGYCYQMKVIQAFSWMNFVLVAFALIILMQLTTQAQMFGRYHIWMEPIRGQILIIGKLPALNVNRTAMVRRSTWVL